MQFKDFLYNYLSQNSSNLQSVSSKNILESFKMQITEEIEKDQFFELGFILKNKHNLFEYLIKSTFEAKFKDQLVQCIANLTTELDECGLEAPTYAYYIYSYLLFLSKTHKGFDDLEEVKYNKVSLSNKDLITKTFETQFFKNSKLKEDLTIEGTRLVSYKGNSPYVVIPDGVTEIGFGAFKGNKNLAFLNIPNSVISIEPSAFANCPKLIGVFFSRNVVDLPKECFSNCKSLHFINNATSIVNVGDLCFYKCENLEKLTFVANVLKNVGVSAFSGCKKLILSDAVLNGLAYVAEKSFANTGLVKVVLSESEVHNEAFADCEGLNHVSFAKKVNIVGESIFKNDSKLMTMDFACAIKTPISKIIDNSEKIDFAKSYPNLTRIRTGSLIEGQFESINSVKEITTFAGNFIPKRAFNGCSSLYKVKIISDLLLLAEDHCFADCTSLKTIELPNGIRKLEDYAFLNCSSLENVSFLKDVTVFGSHCLEGAKLTGFSFDRNFEEIHTNAFLSSNGFGKISELNLSSSKIFNEGLSGLGEIDLLVVNSENLISDSNKNFSFSDSSFVYKKIRDISLNSVILFKNKNLESAELNISSGQIPNNAFKGCPKLKEVIIHSSEPITEIGSSAFAKDTKLENIVATFGDHINVCDNAFNSCSSLNLKLNFKDIARIGAFAFADCSLTKDLIISDETILDDNALANVSNVDSISLSCENRNLKNIFSEDIGLSLKNLVVLDEQYKPQEFYSGIISLHLPNVTDIEFSIEKIKNYVSEIYVGDNVQNISGASCSQFTKAGINLVIPETNNYLSSVDGSILSKDGKTLYYLANAETFEKLFSLELLCKDSCLNYNKPSLYLEDLIVEDGAFGNSKINSIVSKNSEIKYSSFKNLKDLTIINKDFNFEDTKEKFTVPSSVINLKLENVRNGVICFKNSNKKIKEFSISNSEDIRIENLVTENLYVGNCDSKSIEFTDDSKIDALSISERMIDLTPFKTSPTFDVNLLDVDEITYGAFFGLGIKKLTVTGNPYIEPGALTGFKSIENCEFINSDYSLENSMLHNADNTQLLSYVAPVGKKADFTFTNKKIILHGALNGIIMNNVVISDGKQFEKDAFVNCIITNLTCGELDCHLMEISKSFASVTNLTFTGKRISEGQFSNLENLQTVTLEKECLVEASAFENDTKLEKINSLNIVDEVGDYAFANTKLTNFELSDKVNRIGIKVFESTPVNSLVIPFLGPNENVGCGFNYLFGDNNHDLVFDELIIDSGKVDKSFFSSISKVNMLAMPKSYKVVKKSDIDQINEIGFFACRYIETVEDYAFDGKEIQIRFDSLEDVVSIGEAAFKGCTFLFDHNSGNKVCLNKIKKIGKGAFYLSNANRLVKDLTLDLSKSNLKNIPSQIVAFSFFSNVLLPEKLESIDSYAFEKMEKNNSFFIPKNVLKVGDEIFKNTKVGKVFVYQENEISWSQNWNKNAKGLFGHKQIKPKYIEERY